jgi:hypothetical protein
VQDKHVASEADRIQVKPTVALTSSALRLIYILYVNGGYCNLCLGLNSAWRFGKSGACPEVITCNTLILMRGDGSAFSREWP